jgi:tetratricopeptide (TPR) repeat protein
LTIDGEIPPLSIGVVQLMPKRELNILSPFADAETIDAARKTAEGLLARWRRGDITLTETLYALGLAAMAARGKVDGETADRLLHAASPAVQWAAHPVALSTVLSALRPLGEKAPHRYVIALAAASDLETLDSETVQYIYYALQRLRGRLLKAERIWPLVETVRAYSNLLMKHPDDIKDRWEEAVANMCELYSKVRGRSAVAAPEGGFSVQRLLSAAAGAYVLAMALGSDDLAPLVQRYCGLGDLERAAEAIRSVLNKAAATATDYPEELKKVAESDMDFAKWVTARNVIGDAGIVVEDLSAWFTAVLTQYKLVHALDEKGELDAGKLEEASKEFENLAKVYKKLRLWRNYLAVCDLALKARILAAGSWEELLERAEGFQELWREAGKYPELTAEYLATAAHILGEYLVYLAVSSNKDMAKELLKKRRWLLDYVPEVSVVIRLMLRLFGVGEGARQGEVVVVFGPRLSPEFRPALSMLAGRLQRDKALDECAKLPKAEDCDVIVASAAGNRVAAEILRSEIKKRLKLKTESETQEAHLLLGKADGRTLVEVLASIRSRALLAFMLLAAVEGRADAVRLHGLLGSAGLMAPLPRRLFRAVYENCGDLNSEGCRLALLKLYYLHF